MELESKAKLPLLPLLVICLLALWLRLPGISAGLPYLYWEDDTHHLNRTIEMVKFGQWNPNYFHKPSLHFYLRMPVVAASFIWSVKKGHIKALREIETRNPYGLAGYNFTASHPGIVKWNRAFSVFLSLLLVIITAQLTFRLSGSDLAALAAALFTSVSPEVLRNSPIIGVDILMSLLCVAAVCAGLKVQESYSKLGLGLCGVLCGLAISSKYNALPIVFVPICIAILSDQRSVKALAIAILTPILGFFIGSPFILVSIPMFLDQLGYEIWHYAVAGHEGNTAEPGLQQAIFYFRWLLKDGVGIAISFLSLLGVYFIFKANTKRALVFMAFPMLFAALMIGQKANFTRNVVVLVPFVAILGAVGFTSFFDYLRSKSSTAMIFFWLLLPFMALQPLVRSVQFRAQLNNIPESRKLASEYISANLGTLGDTAISGELQFPTQLYRQHFAERVDLTKTSPLKLALEGFSTVVAGPEFAIAAAQGLYLKQIYEFPGLAETQRIISNPFIRIFSLQRDAVFAAVSELFESNQLDSKLIIKPSSNAIDLCPSQSQASIEGHCWLTSTATAVSILDSQQRNMGHKTKLNMLVMSPWEGQEVSLKSGNWSKELVLDDQLKGAWVNLSLDIPTEILHEQRGILFILKQVHSPLSHGLSQDPRRLGLAIKELTVK